MCHQETKLNRKNDTNSCLNVHTKSVKIHNFKELKLVIFMLVILNHIAVLKFLPSLIHDKRLSLQ